MVTTAGLPGTPFVSGISDDTCGSQQQHGDAIGQSLCDCAGTVVDFAVPVSCNHIGFEGSPAFLEIP